MTKEKSKEIIDNQVENIETEDETRKVATEARGNIFPCLQ
jgi:hypothetical protein